MLHKLLSLASENDTTVNQQKNKQIQNFKSDFNSVEDLYKWGEELAWTVLGFKPGEK